MIKGRLSLFAVTMHAVLVAVAAGAFLSYPEIFSDGDITTDDPVFYILFFLFLIYAGFAAISPFVSLKSIRIDADGLTYRYPLLKKVYPLNEVEGFFIMEIPSRDYTYETIYPVSRGRILPSVSSFYISNYQEIKSSIPLKDLGRVRFSWGNYLVVVTSKKYNELKR